MKWSTILKEESTKDYFKNITANVLADAQQHKIFPPHKDIFNAFKYCPYNKTKVVILGQDPYHGEGQAHGLAFSVQPGQAIPPSLKNIFKELKDDVDVTTSANGCLTGWARQGILLLNTSLTVREGLPGSHAEFGWDVFTNQIISHLNKKSNAVVFILWGAHAKKKIGFITNPNHTIITGTHPSPLGANKGGFFGTKPFSTTNEILVESGQDPIDWSRINK